LAVRDDQHERLANLAGETDVVEEPGYQARHLIRDDDLQCCGDERHPVACQIDGDFVGPRDAMTFTAVPDALGVVAPPQRAI